MQMNITATTPPLTRQFIEIKASLSAWDANWTAVQHTGSVPSMAVSKEIRNLALRLDDARTGFRNARPEATDLHEKLQLDMLQVAHLGGQLGTMAVSHLSIGSGWSTLLDGPINDITRAIKLLDS